MKRRLTTLGLFLLLGAVLNVAVAWGVALWAPPLLPSTTTAALSQQEATALLLRLSPSEWPEVPEVVGRQRRAVGQSSHDAFKPYEKDTPWFDVALVGEHRFGLPAAAVCHVYIGGDDGHFPGDRLIGGWRIRRQDVLRDTLPLRPIWPGFAINTLFYAAILWPLISGPFALRHHIRRKRGLCVSCGYDLRHANHDVCPECGWRRETDASRALR
ncbi:MAG: hypothetical protein IH830_11215 [Planctomycetes bacterium]|nr:hypothetical protein [Planctomycetota bacterium]